ncbi:MAG: thermonuclease family protein [Thermomicrobiales bacterium]
MVRKLRTLLLLTALLATFSSAPFSDAIAQDDDNLDTFTTWGAEPRPLPVDVEEMVVDRIVDGDTINLTYPGDNWYYRVRIIGIDTPEKNGPYTDEECYGPESSAELTSLLPEGTIVYVEQDVTDEDRNGRWLRHVWLPFADEDGNNVEDEAYLVSEILVLGGFADARAYDSEEKHIDLLEDAEEEARTEDLGFWGAC